MKWGVVSEEYEMRSGNWQVGNVKWGIAFIDYKCGAASEAWQVRHGKWRLTNGIFDYRLLIAFASLLIFLHRCLLLLHLLLLLSPSLSLSTSFFCFDWQGRFAATAYEEWKGNYKRIKQRAKGERDREFKKNEWKKWMNENKRKERKKEQKANDGVSGKCDKI